MLFDTVAEGEVAVEEEQVLTWSSTPEPQKSPPRWHPRHLSPPGLCCFVFETEESDSPHSLNRHHKETAGTRWPRGWRTVTEPRTRELPSPRCLSTGGPESGSGSGCAASSARQEDNCGPVTNQAPSPKL